MPDFTLHLGDCLAVLPTLPDASVDAVVTDPPYSSGGMYRGDRAAPTTTKYVCDHEVRNFHPAFAGDGRDQRTFGMWAVLWLRECLRIAKDGAPVCCFTDWRQLPTVADALQIAGWVWRGVVVWDKTEGARPTVGRFKQQAEFVVWGSKGALPQREDVGCLNGVFRAAPFRGKQHIAGKPESLMRELICICPPGGTVLDPFMGSGTTGLVCVENGLGFVGVEVDATYHEIARRRIAAAQPNLAVPEPAPPEAPSLFAKAAHG